MVLLNFLRTDVEVYLILLNRFSSLACGTSKNGLDVGSLQEALHSVEQIIVHVVVEGTVVLNCLWVQDTGQSGDVVYIQLSLRDGHLVHFNASQNRGDIGPCHRAATDLILIYLIVVADHFLVRQADVLHLMQDVADEVVDLGLCLAQFDDADLRLLVVILLVVGSPLKSNHIRLIQVPPDTIKTVQGGPELKHSEVLLTSERREDEKAAFSDHNPPLEVDSLASVVLVLLKTSENAASLGMLSFVMLLHITSLLNHSVLEVAQIVHLSKVILAIDLHKDGFSAILSELDQVLRLSNLLLLDSSILILFDGLDEVRKSSNYLMQVARHLPVLTIEHFGVQVLAVIQVDVLGEPCESVDLRLGEGIHLVQIDLKLKVTLVLLH